LEAFAGGQSWAYKALMLCPAGPSVKSKVSGLPQFQVETLDP